MKPTLIAQVLSLALLSCVTLTSTDNDRQPVLALSAKTPEVRTGDTIVLRAAASDSFGRIVKYEWRIGDSGPFTASTSPNIRIPAPDHPADSLKCIVRVTDDNGNTAYDTVSVKVVLTIDHFTSVATGWPFITGKLVAFNNKIWAIGTGSMGPTVHYSTDGILWTEVTTDTLFSKNLGLRTGYSITAFSGKLRLIGGSDTSGPHNDLWTSVDGAAWTLTAPHCAFSPRKNAACLEHNGTLWLFSGEDSSGGTANDIWRSHDGTTWECVAAHLPFAFSARAPLYTAPVAISEGAMVTFGADTGGTRAVYAWRSIDGKNWTKGPNTADDCQGDLFACNNLFWSIPFGQHCAVWYSQSGTTWTQASDDAMLGASPSGIGCVYNDKLWLFGTQHCCANSVWYYGQGR